MFFRSIKSKKRGINLQNNRCDANFKIFLGKKGSIISVVGKTTVEIIELFECTQK
ncbi:hypothetical protein GPU39_09135, partial [Streptococcus thermophilus]|nr:hypothetical protein [Streptococcus thermophilus]